MGDKHKARLQAIARNIEKTLALNDGDQPNDIILAAVIAVHLDREFYIKDKTNGE